MNYNNIDYFHRELQVEQRQKLFQFDFHSKPTFGASGGAGQLKMAWSKDAVNSYKKAFISTKKSSQILSKLDSVFPHFTINTSIHHVVGIFILLRFSNKSRKNGSLR